MSKLRQYNSCCDVVIIIMLMMMMILILMMTLAMNNQLLYCEYYESMKNAIHYTNRYILPADFSLIANVTACPIKSNKFILTSVA